ncbi:MAG: hypothetical protein M3296_10715 [Actinomycetota bacterium]|nr:hypothetical protein [Actinomycetota bacterium]
MADEERIQEDSDGAQGGASADKLPAEPAEDDDTPLGDTDQHSDVPSPPPQTGG